MKYDTSNIFMYGVFWKCTTCGYSHDYKPIEKCEFCERKVVLKKTKINKQKIKEL